MDFLFHAIFLQIIRVKKQFVDGSVRFPASPIESANRWTRSYSPSAIIIVCFPIPIIISLCLYSSCTFVLNYSIQIWERYFEIYNIMLKTIVIIFYKVLKNISFRWKAVAKFVSPALISRLNFQYHSRVSEVCPKKSTGGALLFLECNISGTERVTLHVHNNSVRELLEFLYDIKNFVFILGNEIS